ncbi:response regulator [Roseomonas nepalensis]|uniref:Response regulator n=1 Tax=Muricoccus nepalensis TaxID=1854500 RepID=A0A502GEA7_9PROT|nr:response regulator [Roseomonas nepalensis]TPG60459.1 response regulator [Roseomonas nepalensis]
MTNGAPPPILAGRRVLVVEDQYLLADDMRLLIERLGGEVLGPFSTVPGALAALGRERPDLALLDVNLDGEEVYTVAEALQAAGIPFVFTTGYDPGSLDPRFGAAPHLEKPIATPALLAALGKLGLG